MYIKNFSYESPGERILKIGPHLPKLLSNIKWLTFLWDTLYITTREIGARGCVQLTVSV